MTRPTAIIIFLLSVFLLNFSPVKDADFGWHYRCGREALVQGEWCTGNRFSYYLPRYQSYNPSFVYDLFLALVYDRFGFVGVSVAGGAVMALAGAVFLAFFPAEALWMGMVFFYLLLFLSLHVFASGLRSQMVSFLFLVTVLLTLDRFEKNPRLFLGLPFLFLLWVNTHIGFFVGLVLLVFFVLARRSVLTLAVGLVSFLSTLINPFGVKVYQEIANHTAVPMGKMIAEWTPPPVWQKGLIIFVLLAVLAKVFLRLTLDTPGVSSRRHSRCVWAAGPMMVFAVLALMARRSLPLFYLASFYILAKMVDWKRLGKKLNITPELAGVFSLALPLAVGFIAWLQVGKTLTFDRSRPVYCSKGMSRYPCRLLEKRPNLSGNIYAMYEWGGFLIWQKPGSKVFVDGRIPAWHDEAGKSPYQVFLYIIQARPGWNETLRQTKTDYIMINKGTFLDLLLDKKAVDYGWQKIDEADGVRLYQSLK